VSLRRDLFQFLRGAAKRHDAGISWGFSADDKKYPRIVLRLTSSSPDHHTRGRSGFNEATVQATVYAKAEQNRSASTVADRIADTVAETLDGYTGPIGESTFLASSELTSRFQVEEQPIDGGEWIFGIVLEFDISHGVPVHSGG